MKIKSYIFRRVIQMIPLIIGVIFINFFLIYLSPGDPITILVGDVATSLEYIEMMRKAYGLDLPIQEQFFIYLTKILKGDLGRSIIWNAPVIKIIFERLPATILLIFTSLIFSIIIGISLGILSSREGHPLFENLSILFSIISYSIPIFLLGIMLLLIFSVYLNMFPIGGMTSLYKPPALTIEYAWDLISHLTLPALTLSFSQISILSRLSRTGLKDVLNQDYITMAKASGIPHNKILYKYALRNVSLPIVTWIGIRISATFGGAILTETIFGWPGLGRLMYDSVMYRDYPTVMGLLFFVAILVSVMNLIVDISYGLLDPRVSY